jgi:hypothetical protein
MKLKLLQRRHADFDAETLQTYEDLLVGGAQFRKHATRYLIQNDVEPKSAFEKRAKASHYLNYVAPLANFFASWLFSSQLTYRADGSADEEAYAEFQEDSDGTGTSLERFLRQRFVEALTVQRAYWRVVFPTPMTAATDLAEYEALGLNRPTLEKIPACCVVNWRRAADGSFLWLLEYRSVEELLEIENPDATVTETWTLWRADGTARRWQLRRDKRDHVTPDTDVPEIDPPHNPIAALPIVELQLPPELWLVDQIADAQLEHFRQRNALSHAIRRTCFAMPVFNLKDTRKKPTLGTGYYLMIGLEEKVSWPAPDAAPFAVVEANAAGLKDEIHRVAAQLGRGVDNNAAAVGRSAESKQQDDSATEIVLRAYGGLMRDAAERTFDLVSLGRDDDIAWDVSGMDKFHVTDAKAVTDLAVASGTLQIPSATYRRELAKRVVRAQLPDLDEKTARTIEKEIEAGITNEDLVPPPAPPPPGPPNDGGGAPPRSGAGPADDMNGDT